MKLEFNTIHIENFLSIGSADVDLTAKGFTAVNGVNENPNDSAKSNGAGKSTIFEAIVWSLVGETVRGSKEVVNLFGDDGALVELNFKADCHQYKIIRTKDHSKLKSNLKIFIDGEDKSGKGIRDSEKLLANYLPELTPELLGSVIILGQGLPQRFTNNTPSGRKEVLEKLSKSDFMIEDVKSRLAARKSELNTDKRNIEDSILKVTTDIQHFSSDLAAAKKSLGELPNQNNVELSIAQCNLLLNILNESLTQCNLELNTSEEQLQRETANQLTIMTRLNSIKELINANHSDFINTKIAEETQLKIKLGSVENELKRLKGIKDICPTCGQKLPNIEKPDTSNLELELIQLKNELAVISEAIKNDNTAKASELSVANAECTTGLSECELSISKLSSNIKSIKANVSDLEVKKLNQEKELVKLNETKDNLARIELELKDRITTLENNIKVNESNLANLNEQLINVDIHLEVINKMTNLVSRDFRGYLLSNVISFIDSKSKDYASELFGTTNLSFKLDGNNISISYCGKEYECLSGGEKQKVDLIVQFAIRDMLCKYLNFSSNIIVLDELADNIDSYGAEKLFNLIAKKLNDVKSIYIISHHTDFSLPVDNEITIKKGANGISYIQ